MLFYPKVLRVLIRSYGYTAWTQFRSVVGRMTRITVFPAAFTLMDTLDLYMYLNTFSKYFQKKKKRNYGYTAWTQLRSMVGRIMTPKNAHALIPGTHEYVTSRQQMGLEGCG